MTLRAAIYARRSTEEHQQDSLETQIDGARRWIAARGWSVADAHVFTDSGISRAEFVKRPALLAMLGGAKRRDFDVVVMRDDTRLGGDMLRTSLLVQDLAEHGVELWYYFSNEQVRGDDPTSRLLITLKSYVAELERVRIVGRTQEALRRKAERGLCTGTACYGYNRVELVEDGRRRGVDWEINPDEAATVRWIFERSASGDSARAIAKALNDAGIASPRAGGRRGTGSWCPTAVREMLLRERYRGEIVWGREGKSYKGGTRIRVSRDESQVVRAIREDLRIVDEDLWRSVRERFAQTRAAHGGASWGRAVYLLSGIARCASCGGPINVANTKHGKTTIKAYGCSYFRNRGKAVCGVAIRRPIEELDDAVIDFIQRVVLDELTITRVIDRVIQKLDAEQAPAVDPRAGLVARVVDLEAQLKRLTRAIALTDDADALVTELGAVQRQLRDAKRDLEAAQPQRALRASRDTIVTTVRGWLGRLREVFAQNTGETRKALERMLQGPLLLRAIGSGRGSRFSITGSVSLRTFPGFGDPNGI